MKNFGVDKILCLKQID